MCISVVVRVEAAVLLAGFVVVCLVVESVFAGVLVVLADDAVVEGVVEVLVVVAGVLRLVDEGVGATVVEVLVWVDLPELLMSVWRLGCRPSNAVVLVGELVVRLLAVLPVAGAAETLLLGRNEGWGASGGRPSGNTAAAWFSSAKIVEELLKQLLSPAVSERLLKRKTLIVPSITICDFERYASCRFCLTIGHHLSKFFPSQTTADPSWRRQKPLLSGHGSVAARLLTAVRPSVERIQPLRRV
jgi:hypothetical protein